MDTLKTKLLPLADIITPNISEAEDLCGFKIENTDEMIEAAKKIADTLKGYVLIKGGHLADCADDLLYLDDKAIWYKCPKINNPNTHGTGCTLSSAIACNLANGLHIEESVKNAKAYITGALKAHLDLGKGSGPLNHCYGLSE